MKTKLFIFTMVFVFACMMTQTKSKGIASRMIRATDGIKNSKKHRYLNSNKGLYGHLDKTTSSYRDIYQNNGTQDPESNNSTRNYENLDIKDSILELDERNYKTYVIFVVLCFALLLITGLGIALYFCFCKNYSFKGLQKTIISEDFANMPVSEKQETIKNTLATNPKYDKYSDQKYDQVKINKDREEASQVIANLTTGNSKECSGDLIDVDNLYLDPNNTQMYKYLKKIMEEYDELSPQDDKDKTKRETNRQHTLKRLDYIFNKLKFFVDNATDIFRNPNKIISAKIVEYKTKLEKINKLINRYHEEYIEKIKQDLFSLISAIWIHEESGIFEICNTALLMDIYYSVVGVNEPLKVFKEVNCDFGKKEFERKIEILAPYCACLCLIAKETSDNNREQNFIYRGIGFNADREYTQGKNYRFASFQTGSDNRITAEEYANSENSIFLKISLPERCNNWVNIQEADSVNKNEYIVMPYSSFKLDQKEVMDLMRTSRKYFILFTFISCI